MGKRYADKKKSGCGCGTIFGVLLLISLVITYWPFFVLVALIALAIWYFKYYPQQKVRKQQAKEIKDIEEVEEKIALENRRLQVKSKEAILKKEHAKLNKTEWKCSYCLTAHSPEEDKCHNCGASKE